MSTVAKTRNSSAMSCDDDIPIVSPAMKRPFPNEGGYSSKRTSLGADGSPPPFETKKNEIPVFSLKKFFPYKWREHIPSGEDIEVPEFPCLIGNDAHLRRVWEFASSYRKGNQKNADDMFSHAAGKDWSWKGNPNTKSMPFSLYAEIMKLYIPCEDDYVIGFPEVAHLEDTDEIVLTQLDINEYFFEGAFPMWYCSRRYPNLPKAIEEMDCFQRYQPVFEREKQADATYYQQRQQQLVELKEIKSKKKAEFIQALKQISISSCLDFALIKLSTFQNKPKDLPTEVRHMESAVLGLQKSINQVELLLKPLQPLHSHICKNLHGMTVSQLMADVDECLNDNESLQAVQNMVKEAISAVKTQAQNIADINTKLAAIVAFQDNTNTVIEDLNKKMDKVIDALTTKKKD